MKHHHFASLLTGAALHNCNFQIHKIKGLMGRDLLGKCPSVAAVAFVMPVDH